MDIEYRRVRVADVELNVALAGSGPAVLLIHGFPDDHTVWREQIPALVAAGYRVIAPDTRGCGDSDMSPRVRDYHTDRLTADLVGLLDALGVERARVVGHDWGAVQAWCLAMRHPGRVERLIALSVGHPYEYAHAGFRQKLLGFYTIAIQLRGLIEFLVTRFDWWAIRRFAGFPSEFPRIRERLSRPGRLTAGFNYYRANISILWAQGPEPVRVPVTGIWSDGDRFLVERQMTGSARLCEAGWTYVRLEGPNHWLQLDAPDRVTPLILEHLRRSASEPHA
ncbi:MAG: alpha/beta fold hydrolase [Steroidobacteraceae bacterium]